MKTAMRAAQFETDPGDVAARLTGRDYLSFTAINTYANCPLRYYFRYVQGLPEETVLSSLAFGSGIHAAVEHHFQELLAGNPAPDQDTLLDVFWDAWHRKSEQATIQFGASEDADTIGHMADRVLKAFRQSELASPPGTIVGIEEELRGAIIPGVPDLLAYIDLLVETDDALVVTDFKTARSRWSAEQAEDNGEQLLLYGELAARLAPAKNLRVEFAVISKTKQPVAERHPVQINPQRIVRAKRMVERIWQAIQGGHFYPAPSPLNCPGCPFRESCQSWPG
jgi:putative RecB family exonuclease